MRAAVPHAPMDLARLGPRRARGAEGRRRLGELLAEFTEGLDTADLRRARTLFDATS